MSYVFIVLIDLLKRIIKTERTEKTKDNVKNDKMKTEKQLQRQFYSLVSDVITNTPGDLSKFGETLGMISTLSQDNKLTDLLMILRLHFPEYYSNYKPFIV